MSIGTNVLNTFDSPTTGSNSKPSGFNQTISKQQSSTGATYSEKAFNDLLLSGESTISSEVAQLLPSMAGEVESRLDDSQSQNLSLEHSTFVQTGDVEPVISQDVISSKDENLQTLVMRSQEQNVIANSVPKAKVSNTDSTFSFAALKSVDVAPQVATRTELLSSSFSLSEKTTALTELKVNSTDSTLINREVSQNLVFKATIPTKNSETADVGQKLVSILADKINLQSNTKVSNATIRLDPPELGKLDLFVRVEGDRLNVHINSSTSHVREAIAQTVERLRVELVQENFLEVNVTVGEGNQDQPNWGEESLAANISQSLVNGSSEIIDDESYSTQPESILARV